MLAKRGAVCDVLSGARHPLHGPKLSTRARVHVRGARARTTLLAAREQVQTITTAPAPSRGIFEGKPPAASFLAGALTGYVAALIIQQLLGGKTAPAEVIVATSAGPVAITEEALAAVTDAPMFTLDGTVTNAKVIKVYDGDTVTVVMPVKGELLKFSCRLKGINAPEMKPPKNQPGRDEEVVAAKLAQEALSGMLLGKVVTVRCYKPEKYGRQLVEIWNESAGGVFTKERSVNQEMVRRGLARVFMDDDVAA